MENKNNTPKCSVKKRKRGKPIKSGEKQCVLNVFNKLASENPGVCVDEIVKMTSSATGISVASIYRIRSELAKQFGKTVLRLPPYHCALNPIELIWSQVKGYVARHNVTFKLPDVQCLLQDALSHVTPESWQNCIKHIIAEEKKMWNLDGLKELAIEPLIVNLQESDSGSEFSDIGSTDMEGFEPLSDSE